MVCCFSSFSKEQRLNDLSEAVQHCTLCPRLCNRKKVLSDANGNVNSKILFVAEAPGRLGADRTGIPLYGDQTGDNFEVLLADVGWKREQVFITNAVLCNPCTEQGKCSFPRMIFCSIWLIRKVAVSPKKVISWREKALQVRSLFSLQEREVPLFRWMGSTSS